MPKVINLTLTLKMIRGLVQRELINLGGGPCWRRGADLWTAMVGSAISSRKSVSQ